MPNIVLDAAAEVITKNDSRAVVLAAQHVDADALPDGDESDVVVSNIYHGTALPPGQLSAVIQRLRLCAGAEHYAPIRQIRLEHSLQHDSARILPFLERRRRLGQSNQGREGPQHEGAPSEPSREYRLSTVPPHLPILYACD